MPPLCQRPEERTRDVQQFDDDQEYRTHPDLVQCRLDRGVGFVLAEVVVRGFLFVGHRGILGSMNNPKPHYIPPAIGNRARPMLPPTIVSRDCFRHSESYSLSAHTRTSPSSSISTRITFGRQQTGQSSTYSCLDPADRSIGATISSPQESQL